MRTKKVSSPSRYSKRIIRKPRWGHSIRNEINCDPELLEKVTGPHDPYWDQEEDQPEPQVLSVRGI